MHFAPRPGGKYPLLPDRIHGRFRICLRSAMSTGQPLLTGWRPPSAALRAPQALDRVARYSVPRSHPRIGGRQAASLPLLSFPSFRSFTSLLLHPSNRPGEPGAQRRGGARGRQRNKRGKNTIDSESSLIIITMGKYIYFRYLYALVFVLSGMTGVSAYDCRDASPPRPLRPHHDGHNRFQLAPTRRPCYLQTERAPIQNASTAVWQQRGNQSWQ
jgi:hypothetical protein